MGGSASDHELNLGMTADTFPTSGPPLTSTGRSSLWLAFLFFIAVEVVLFGSFLSAFVYLRVHGGPWPPAGPPRLDPNWPTLNLVILLASGALGYSAELAIRRYRITLAEKLLLGASALGLLFLLGQVYEFLVLFRQGISPSTGIYGSLFYTLIGFHGAHVLSGIAWLVTVWYLTRQARQTPPNHFAVQAATLYWSFVTVVWIAIYLLLYVV